MRIGSFPGSRLTLFLVCSAALLACCFVPPSALAQNEKGAGITMAADADAKDIGLPLYPGARRHKDKDSDSPGINFDLWGGGSGVKLAVLKLESDDSPGKIADYYKKRLSKYGKVLDCSHPTDNATDSSDKDDDSKPLDLRLRQTRQKRPPLQIRLQIRPASRLDRTQPSQQRLPIPASPHSPLAKITPPSRLQTTPSFRTQSAK